jgi:hypothetical protein
VTRLADEYFKRDLSEAEEQQLSDELASSSEDAQHMADRMGEIYAQTGLPEPVWQDKPLPSSLIPGKHIILKKFFPLGLTLVTAGVLCYWGYHCLNRPTEDLLPSIPSESLTQQPAVQPDSKKAVTAKIAQSAAKKITAVAAPAKVLKSSTGTYQPKHPQSSGSMPVPAEPGKYYQQLSVVVDLPQSALATVRVYDNLNNEIRMLFAGILPQGKKTFAWDGKDEAGLVAPPGVYVIEVKSGENVMRQEVRVQADQAQ